MRQILRTDSFPVSYFLLSLLLNLVYFLLSLLLFRVMFEKSRAKGLARLE
jgi:ABC-2 type transport system permease protein